jgi:hypothetical protein
MSDIRVTVWFPDLSPSLAMVSRLSRLLFLFGPFDCDLVDDEQRPCKGVPGRVSPR